MDQVRQSLEQLAEKYQQAADEHDEAFKRFLKIDNTVNASTWANSCAAICRRIVADLDELAAETEKTCGEKQRDRWISVKDRLPEDEVRVLCCTRNKAGRQNMVLGYYVAESKYWAVGMNSNVTHWMPLPVPLGEDKQWRNIDRLRSLNAEQLAEWLCDRIDCYNCPVFQSCTHELTELIAWLLQEESGNKNEEANHD